MTDIELKSIKTQKELQKDILKDTEMILYGITQKSKSAFDTIKSAERNNSLPDSERKYILTKDQFDVIYDFSLLCSSERWVSLGKIYEDYIADLNIKKKILSSLI